MLYKIYRLLTTVHSLRNLSRNISIDRILCGNHYETLKLSRNCTTKDVRDSFIRLSKQCHPDKNKNDPNAHSQFVKLSEAYRILSHSDKRHAYDLTLKRGINYNQRYDGTPSDGYTRTYGRGEDFNHEFFWTYRGRTRHNYDRDEDYYGIKGLKRVRNGWIALLCVVFSAVGVCLQVILIKKSTAFNRQRLDEQSQHLGRVLADVQQQAITQGNRAQLERLKLNLTASQTLNHEVMQQAQETYSRDAQNMTYSSSSSGPSVMLVPDTETLEYFENSKCSESTLEYRGETPHNLERESKNATDELEDCMLTSPDALEGKAKICLS